MFNHLMTNLTTSKEMDLDIVRSVRKAQKAGVSYANIQKTITLALERMSVLVQDFRDMRQFAAVVKAHGINLALMEFSNPHNKIFPTLISNFPSNESFDMVSVDETDPRTRKVLDGIENVLETEPEQLAEWIESCASDLDEMFDETEAQLDGVDEIIDYHNQCSDDIEDKPMMSLITTIPCKTACDCMDGLITCLNEYNGVIEDPTDKDAMDDHAQRMASIVDTIGEHTGLYVHPANPHLILNGDTEDCLVESEDTVDNHGYNKENLQIIINKTLELLNALRKFIDKKDTFVGHLENTSDLILSIDNDVPPAITDAISGDTVDAEEALSGGMMTQTDVIHNQVASSVCCCCSMMATAVQMVHNTLDVVDHVTTVENS